MPAKSASTCARPSPGSPSPLTAIRKLPSPPASASPASRAAMTARRRSWRVQTRRSTPPKERAAIGSLPTPPSLPGRNLAHKWLEHQPFSDAAVSARGPKRWPTGAALPRAPCGLPSKLLGGLHFGCRSAFLPRGNCGRRDQRDFGAARRNGARMSLYNSNPHGFSGPPHLLRPVGCDRPKRLGVASSCYAALGRSKARSGQRPLWSTTWQAGVRGCSDFYPAADVSHGPGHHFSQTVRLCSRAPAAVSRRLRRCERACRSSPLFDLGFLEGHVLARDRIVFFEGQLLGRRARVLLGDVEKAGARRAQ